MKLRKLLVVGLCGFSIIGSLGSTVNAQDNGVLSPSEYVENNAGVIKEELNVSEEAGDKEAALNEMTKLAEALNSVSMGSYKMTYQNGLQINDIVMLTGYSSVGEFSGTEGTLDYTFNVKTSSETRGTAVQNISNSTLEGYGVGENIYTKLMDTATTLPLDYVPLLEGKYYQEARGGDTAKEVPVEKIKNVTNVISIVRGIAEKDGKVYQQDGRIVVEIPVDQFVSELNSEEPLEDVLGVISAVPDAKTFKLGIDSDSVSINVLNDDGGVISNMYIEVKSGDVSIEAPEKDMIVTEEQFGSVVKDYEERVKQMDDVLNESGEQPAEESAEESAE